MSSRIRSASVGASPRINPVRVSRAESATPTVPEVRCACQYFQSDSLLPERVNPVGSRPPSQADYYVESISRPTSPTNTYKSHHTIQRSDIIHLPEPILIDDMDQYHFAPIRESPKLVKKWDSRDNYVVYAEDTSFGDIEEQNKEEEEAEEEVSRPSRGREPNVNMHISSQILRNRSQSTSRQGSITGSNVGKIVKTVSFEFGPKSGNDLAEFTYKDPALSTVKFERKDRAALGIDRNYDIR